MKSPHAWLSPHVADVLPAALEAYLDVHSNPELSGQEERTAALACDVLRRLGGRVTEGVGGHGVVALLENGPGPRVLVRAELDALPVEERTGVPYASVATAVRDGLSVPVMHACGHDAHLAALLGAVDLLARMRERWRGTVMVVAQPAEETLSGAAAMMADGLYDRFGTPDVALAQHLAVFPAGRVAHGATMLAASRSLRIRVCGAGGHAADTSSHANPIEAAADIITGLRAHISPPATCTVGRLQAGAAANVVPEEAVLEVSLRAADPADVDSAEAAVRRLAETTSARHGSPMRVEVATTAAAVPMVNDPACTAVVRDAHLAGLGRNAVLPWAMSMAAEDFPTLSAGGTVPLVYWMLGSVGPRQWRDAPGATFTEKWASFAPNHSPRFRPDPVPVLRTGITAMAMAVLAFLGGDSVSAAGESEVKGGGQPVASAAWDN